MMCVAPVCLISNGWMQNEKYRTFLQKKQNLTDVIAFIACQSFIGTCNYLYYSKQMDQKQVLNEEINTSNECMECFKILNYLYLMEKKFRQPKFINFHLT